MFCGLEKIEDNKYKCWKYTLLGKGVEKKDRDKYVIIDEKEARSVRRMIIAFYGLILFFAIAINRSGPSLLESRFEHIVWFWILLSALFFMVIPYRLNQLYKNFFKNIRYKND